MNSHHPDPADKPIIVTEGLEFSYGSIRALDGLDLTVREGTIHALLGPNGAGKSTLLRVLVNLLNPASGRATVLGAESRTLKPHHLQIIGYVSEDQEIPQWMTGQQLINYCRPMYPTWDDDLVASLVALFDLPLKRKIRTFSLGMKRKLSILLAVAFRPRLVLLDEPFSGLDPIALEDLIVGLLELVGEEAWTVMISTHNMDVVEKLADHVSFIDRGRLLLNEPLESVQSRFRAIEAMAPHEVVFPRELPETWLRPRAAGRTAEFVVSRYERGETEAAVERLLGATDVQASTLSLTDIYIALLRGQTGAGRTS